MNNNPKTIKEYKQHWRKEAARFAAEAVQARKRFRRLALYGGAPLLLLAVVTGLLIHPAFYLLLIPEGIMIPLIWRDGTRFFGTWMRIRQQCLDYLHELEKEYPND